MLNWVQGNEPLLRTDLLGSDDQAAWLPPDGARRWKALEQNKGGLILPVLARIEKLEGLQEISYSLEGLSSAAGPVGIAAASGANNSAVTNSDGSVSNSDTTSNEVRNSEADNEVVGTVRKQVLPALAPKVAVKSGVLEVVDTSGPVEPEVVEPELEPDQTPGYGGEFPRERYFVTQGRSSERGARTRVSSSEPGDYYEVRVPTFIFEHPSLTSYRIAALEVGDEVLGKEIVGRWIKVVSLNGGVGFLPVNDARRAYAR